MLTDLHMHSYYSDGTMSPREIVEDAKKRNVQLIAITDHNVLDSYTELKEAAEEFGIKCMIEKYPLKEVNTAFERMMSSKARFRAVLTM